MKEDLKLMKLPTPNTLALHPLNPAHSLQLLHTPTSITHPPHSLYTQYIPPAPNTSPPHLLYTLHTPATPNTHLLHPLYTIHAVEDALHERLHVVAREQARDPVEDALPPAVIVLLEDVDDGVLGEAELVLLVRRVVVDGDH